MQEPPADVADAQVLDAVRAHWCAEADVVAHLPVGFGAHHWSASRPGEGPSLFVTLDAVGERHSADSLSAAYAGARALAARGLPFVHAGLEPLVVSLGGGLLSATPWLEGHRPERLDVELTAKLLRALHAVEAPPGLPVWTTLVEPDLADELERRLEPAWDAGPLSADTRSLLRAHLPAVRGWVERYHRLAEAAASRPWVATHGEPHHRNQLLTERGPVLLDWESLKLAPAERDLRTLVDAGADPDRLPAGLVAEPDMLELFDLEWRLDEVAQYATRFEAPHTGGADDRTAFAGLAGELTR